MKTRSAATETKPAAQITHVGNIAAMDGLILQTIAQQLAGLGKTVYHSYHHHYGDSSSFCPHDNAMAVCLLREACKSFEVATRHAMPRSNEILRAIAEQSTVASRNASGQAMLSLLRMNTRSIPLDEWAEKYESESVWGGDTFTFDCYERAKIHALHFPDVGEVVFLIDSDMGGGGAAWGAKSLHRVANIHINSNERVFCPEQLCLNSHGEETGHHQLRDSESIGNLRHSLSRLQGNPAAALSDQQLLAVLAYLLGEGTNDDEGLSAILEGAENVTIDDVELETPLVRYTRMRYISRESGIEWFVAAIDTLVGHYTKNRIKPRKRPGFSLKEDTKIIDQYKPKWYTEI
jgi:hypothetical protein